MVLSGGTRLGPYEVKAPIGAGGMGEVYCARDTKLRRDVAIKILPAVFTNDKERLARFEREAQMLATLNHPHIGAIYGIEEANGIRALVLELVEGETLSERLQRGPVPVREALEIARQIAEALESAHERNIIHRDLKPSNVKVTRDGTVKVLDFGLAKVVANAPLWNRGESATMSAEPTREGVIVGTVAYMSPEQARGKDVDKRTDVWAFGCLLYELLTRRRAFPGETGSDTLAAILEREPDWKPLPVATPPQIKCLLSRCLRKELKHRLHDIGDARIELDDVLSGRAQENVVAPAPARMTRRTAINVLAGMIAGAVVAEGVGYRWWSGAAVRSLTQFRIPLPEGAKAAASFNKRVAISPNGQFVAFNINVSGVSSDISTEKFYLHSLRALEPKLLPVAGGAAFFSPDSRWIAFLAGTPGNMQLRKLSLDSAEPVTVFAPVEAYSGGTWAAPESIYFIPVVPGALMQVAAAGGQPRQVVKVNLAKGERQHRYPCALPGGKSILLTVGTADAETFDDAHIAVYNLETAQMKTLVEGGTHPRYSPSGHVLYARGANVFAIPFDAKRLEATGQPFLVLDGVLMSRTSGVANYDVSASGDLVYIPGVEDRGERTLVWVDRNGQAEPLKLPPRPYLHPRISPDMRQVAIEIEGPNHNFYVYDFARDVLSQMTTDGVSHWPVWSPDGRQLMYRSGPMGAFRMWYVPADRSRPAAQLPGRENSESAESWSPQGNAIAYTATTPEAGAHIMVESLEGDHQSRPFADIKAAAGSAKFSPDGRWLAYCSNESKRPQVYVQAFPGPGPKIQVSSDGGTDPVWKRSGGELYFRNGDKMMAVTASTAPTFTAGHSRVLWTGHYSHGMSTSCGPPGATSSNYDVTADGRRFLMVKDDAPDTAVSKQIIMVLDWSDEVTRLSRT